MTAPQLADPQCLCGDKKSEHRLGKRGCKVPDCGCDRYEPADEAQDLPSLARDLEELEAVDPVVRQAAAQLDEAVSSIVTKASAEHPTPHSELARAERERDELRATTDRMARDHVRLLDRNMRAEAELATARTEIEKLGLLLAHAEQYARDLQDNGDVPTAAEVLYAYDAFHCFTCGRRYIPDTAAADHDHPLTPVRVTITRRQP